VSGSGISWAICRSAPQTDNHTRLPPLFFTGRMPFLPPNQQRQSTEDKRSHMDMSSDSGKAGCKLLYSVYCSLLSSKLLASVTRMPILTILLKMMKHQVKSCYSVFIRIVAFTPTHLYLFADNEQHKTPNVTSPKVSVMQLCTEK